MNPSGLESAIQTLIPMILKYGKVDGRNDSSILHGSCQLGIVDIHLRTSQHAQLIFCKGCQFFLQLLTPRLHCKIGLPQSDYWFRRISILYYEVAGIARKMNVRYMPFSALTCFYHIAHMGEMI